MKDLFFKRWTYSVPEEWNELDAKRLLDVIRVCEKGIANEMGILLLFQALAGIPNWQFYMMRTPSLMDVAEECVAFIFGDNTLTKNRLPVWKGFAGPSDEIFNLKMIEFSHAETFFVEYSKTNQEEYLNQLIAVLYRPRRWWFYRMFQNHHGDIRRKFNENLIQKHAGKVAKWPWEVKMAILQFYSACRNRKIDQYEKVFNNSSGEESLNGMWSVMRSVSHGKTFGNIDAVADQYVDTILMELTEVVADAERIEMEANKVTVEH